jgi:hypothetical protein
MKEVQNLQQNSIKKGVKPTREPLKHDLRTPNARWPLADRSCFTLRPSYVWSSRPDAPNVVDFPEFLQARAVKHC